MTNTELMNIAENARGTAYAPYSQFKVGAALLCGDGTVFTGCNVESSCGTSCCAERVAVYTAVAAGRSDFVKIAVAGEGEVFPCGICRQILSEFSDDIIVVVRKGQDLAEYKISELLPYAFKLSN